MDNVINSFFKAIPIIDDQDYGPIPVVQGNMGNGINVIEYEAPSGSNLEDGEIISGILINKNTLSSGDTITITFIGNVSGSPLSYYTTVLTGDSLKQGVIYPFMIKKITTSVPANFSAIGNIKTIPFGFKIPIV